MQRKVAWRFEGGMKWNDDTHCKEYVICKDAESHEAASGLVYCSTLDRAWIQEVDLTQVIIPQNTSYQIRLLCISH